MGFVFVYSKWGEFIRDVLRGGVDLCSSLLTLYKDRRLPGFFPSSFFFSFFFLSSSLVLMNGSMDAVIPSILTTEIQGGGEWDRGEKNISRGSKEAGGSEIEAHPHSVELPVPMGTGETQDAALTHTQALRVYRLLNRPYLLLRYIPTYNSSRSSPL